jgi:2-C-methyl-D-erythritol 4-phosphate cytidylyltransferase/2-C-methyl-D-erythritol 2,4-cyclodiphosphate synthase
MRGFDKLKARINGKAVLTRAVLPFIEYGGFSEIIVSARADALRDFEKLLQTEILTGTVIPSDAERRQKTADASAEDLCPIKFVAAGATRTESVNNALKAVAPDADLVFIHDGARPFLTSAVIFRVLATASACGAAVPVVPAAESALINGAPFPREMLRLAQTPQAFDAAKLKEAYGIALKDDSLEFSDDYSLYAHFFACGSESITAGDPENKKITYPADLPAFYGVGYDIHRFRPGGGFPLAGVRVSSDKSVTAHSDGDAALHALMDAILSAIGKDDIGKLFPDTDPQYKDIDSIILLKHVLNLVKAENAKILNVSLSIILEAPKIARLIPLMKTVLSEVIGISADRIGITATTNEKTSLIGNGEAVACFAAVSVLK